MRCQRCQGCMISDHFMDLQNASGEIDFTGWRCLNCGEITDPVIVRHHQLAASASAQSRRRWWGASLIHSCMPVREGAEGVSHYSVG
jgi:hypothetical protein